MPIYEFVCKACKHEYEKLVKVDQLANCPVCQSAEVERLLSLSGISTAKSRHVTLSEARRRASSNKKDQDHAQREYEQNYIKDHS